MPSCRTSFPSLGSTTGLPLSFVSPARLPRGRIPAGLKAFPMATHKPDFTSRWSSPGLPGSWGVLPYLCPARCHPGRANLPLPSQQDGIVPAIGTTKTATNIHFGADSHGFGNRCLRFQIRLSLHWQDSLSVGGSPYRVGVEPTGLLKRISNAALSPPIPTLQT